MQIFARELEEQAEHTNHACTHYAHVSLTRRQRVQQHAFESMHAHVTSTAEATCMHMSPARPYLPHVGIRHRHVVSRLAAQASSWVEQLVKMIHTFAATVIPVFTECM